MALNRFLENQLFGVNPTDPVTHVGILVVLASCVPAAQTSKVGPARALRDA